MVQFPKGQKLFERPEIYIQHEYLVENVGRKVVFENDCCGPLLLRRVSKLLGKHLRQLLDSEIGQATTGSQIYVWIDASFSCSRNNLAKWYEAFLISIYQCQPVRMQLDSRVCVYSR